MVDNLRKVTQVDFVIIHPPKFTIPNIFITNILNPLPFKEILKVFRELLVHGLIKIIRIKRMTRKE